MAFFVQLPCQKGPFWILKGKMAQTAAHALLSGLGKGHIIGLPVHVDAIRGG